MIRRFMSAAAVATMLAVLGGTVNAEQVTLKVRPVNGVLRAGQKQTTYVKIGLTGFRLDADAERPRANVALVLDKSGSMKGDKIARAREAAIDAIRRLDDDDIVSVITYDSTVQVLVPATKVSDREQIIAQISRIEAGGSTALFAGVSKGAAEVRKFLDRESVNRIILLSDGKANVGPSSPSELGELGGSLSEEGMAVSTMGLGLGYNEDLMVQLASRSGGNHVFIEDADELADIFNEEFDDVLSVVAQEISVTVTIPDNVRPVRVLGNEADINGQEIVTAFTQIYSEQEKFVVLELEVGSQESGSSTQLAQVSVGYANMKSSRHEELSGKAAVTFSDDEKAVEKSVDEDALRDSVILVANERNRLATSLRDKGDVEGAREALLINSAYLGEYATQLKCPDLRFLCDTNKQQAVDLSDAKKWVAGRKEMLELQYSAESAQRGSRSLSARAAAAQPSPDAQSESPPKP